MDDDTRGELKGNSLYFQFEEVSYNIVYRNEEITDEQQQKELIKMANEIILTDMAPLMGLYFSVFWLIVQTVGKIVQSGSENVQCT